VEDKTAEDITWSHDQGSTHSDSILKLLEEAKLWEQCSTSVTERGFSKIQEFEISKSSSGKKNEKSSRSDKESEDEHGAINSGSGSVESILTFKEVLDCFGKQLKESFWMKPREQIERRIPPRVGINCQTQCRIWFWECQQSRMMLCL
jgi:hypothetical protein